MEELPSPVNQLENYLPILKNRIEQVTLAAHDLPRDIPFHRSLDRKFRKDIDTTSARVLSLTNRLLNLSQTFTASSAARVVQNKSDQVLLIDEDDVVDKFHSVVVDVLDPLLEHVVCVCHY